MTDHVHTRQLEVLVQVAELVATLDLDEVLLQTLKLTTETVGASKGSFFLLDEQGHTVQRFIAARDMDPHKKAIVSHQVLDSGLAGWVRKHKEAVLLDDTAEDERWLVLDDGSRVRSALCVPFMLHDQVRGVMTLEHPEPGHFSQEDLRLALALANQTAASLRNAQLFERVERQERELEAVLNSISEGLLAVDHEWRIRLINPAMQSFIGANAGITGKLLHEVTANPILMDLVKILADTKLMHGTKAFELRDDITRKDFVVNVAALHQDDPEKVGYAIALYDVTSLKDLTRLKTHMIKMASHDLKSPLGLLLGYVDLLWTDVSKGVMPDQLYIESIYKAITRMETLIATLLDAHRSENDSLASSPIDPYELVQTMFDDTLPSALQRRHQVVRNIQTNLHPLKGDFVQLREAMNNLFGNAIKYTPDGGQITINVYVEDDRFYFSVKDTGYGIPEDQQKFIFQPYFRANQKTTEHIEGTGVGLSLVKEVVERHGGQPWFISEPGAGSTFGFWLPLLDSLPPEEE